MTTTHPYLQGLQILFTGLADILQQQHASAAEVAAACFAVGAEAAAVVDNARAGGLPALRTRVADELLARRGQIISMASPLCHPLLAERAAVQRLLREHEAEAARLLQLEDLLPHLGRDALLVTLGAVSTHDGRSDYMGLQRVAAINDPEPDEPANGPMPHDPGCCCAPHNTENADDAADPEAA